MSVFTPLWRCYSLKCVLLGNVSMSFLCPLIRVWNWKSNHFAHALGCKGRVMALGAHGRKAWESEDNSPSPSHAADR